MKTYVMMCGAALALIGCGGAPLVNIQGPALTLGGYKNVSGEYIVTDSQCTFVDTAMQVLA